jgi:hypothetical protein
MPSTSRLGVARISPLAALSGAVSQCALTLLPAQVRQPGLEQVQAAYCLGGSGGATGAAGMCSARELEKTRANFNPISDSKTSR